MNIAKTASYLLAKEDASGSYDPAEYEKVASVAAGIIAALASGAIAPGSPGQTLGEGVKGFFSHPMQSLGKFVTSPTVPGMDELKNRLPGMAGAYVAGSKYGLPAGLAGVGSQYLLGQSAKPGGALKGMLGGIGTPENQGTAYRALQFGAPIATGKFMNWLTDEAKNRD